MEEKSAQTFQHSTLTFALQALLARHEAYMADAERDRVSSLTRIEKLEHDKHELETQNANKIEENRQLLDQLEQMNNTVSESDTKIRSLEASLLSSQQAVRRLEAAAARAEDAERHLAALEEEQNQLHQELRLTKEDARSHAQRCKEAQRGILDMQYQLENMEKEARKERERHVEVMDRMERQREVEKQLDTAAGRLKGAAATKTMGNEKSGSNVVNHFVRDLLQDNANLQLGIAELREMLLNSNDEIQSLREQLMHHQPVDQEPVSVAPSLKEELEPHQRAGSRLSQELHIHHHYHVQKQEAKKPRKKRPGLTPGVLQPPSISPAAAILSSSAAAASLSQPDRHLPTHAGAWTPLSNPPSEFASSVPSSPRSNRVSSLFDTNAFDTGLPMSPITSLDPTSPTWRAHHKRPSAASYQSFQTIPHMDLSDVSGTPCHQRGYFDNTIHEEDEDAPPIDEDTPGLTPPEASTEDSMEGSAAEDSEFSSEYLPPPRLRRATSHESIMSLSGGLDIHTLKARPSQMTLRPIGGLEAVVTGVTAQPTLSRTTAKRSDAALRDHFAGKQSYRSVSSPMSAAQSRSSSPASQKGITGGLGKLVGWRPWGANSSNNPDGASNTPTKAVDVPTSTTENKAEKAWSRTPGINQPGSIPGFQQYWASQRRKGAPAKVTAEVVNHDVLDESLRE
ncbi:uncharacterized protein J7T54_004537 [Emericellopsis cladophorae]|uniref:Uncharacterized protein n=1 Tax=Emericellopsis cladophorae TaxID=2686198 RepID=A0A9P9Y5V5_9HYPO|nr:uncharacterized protein J7T54_004537 [Emericellopsis cladophorae]KAI6783991.1 hypothetical protein J7T54_004537 [Emericellopsis cladophorae]